MNYEIFRLMVRLIVLNTEYLSRSLYYCADTHRKAGEIYLQLAALEREFFPKPSAQILYFKTR